MKTTVDILSEAKGILSDEAHWGRGVLSCSRTGRVCALGAIGVAAGLHFDLDDDTDPYLVLEHHPAVTALSAVLPGRDVSDDVRVFEFNDAVHRAAHHAKLIDAFDRAILSLSADTKLDPVPECVEVPA